MPHPLQELGTKETKGGSFTMRRWMFVLVSLLAMLAVVMPVAADNGAPHGAHYNLNIIGVPRGKTQGSQSYEG